MKNFCITIIIFIICINICACTNNNVSDTVNNNDHADTFESIAYENTNDSNNEVNSENLDTYIDQTVTFVNTVDNGGDTEVPEGEQPKVDEVIRGNFNDFNTDWLYTDSINDIELVDVTDLPVQLQTEIDRSEDLRDTIIITYSALNKHIDNLDSIAISNWLTTTGYYDIQGLEIYYVNGEHYKCVIYNNNVYITNQI